MDRTSKAQLNVNNVNDNSINNNKHPFQFDHFQHDILYSTRVSQLRQDRHELILKLNQLKSAQIQHHRTSNIDDGIDVKPDLSSSPCNQSNTLQVHLQPSSSDSKQHAAPGVPPNLAAHYFQIEYEALFQHDGTMFEKACLTSEQSLAIANARHNANIVRTQEEQEEQGCKSDDHLTLSTGSSVASQVSQMPARSHNLRHSSLLSPPPSSSTLSSSSTSLSTHCSSSSLFSPHNSDSPSSYPIERRLNFQRRTFYTLHMNNKKPDSRFAPSAPWMEDHYIGVKLPSPSQNERDMYLKYTNRHNEQSIKNGDSAGAGWVYTIPITNRGIPMYTTTNNCEHTVTEQERKEAPTSNPHLKAQQDSQSDSPLSSSNHVPVTTGHSHQRFQRRTNYPFRKIRGLQQTNYIDNNPRRWNHCTSSSTNYATPPISGNVNQNKNNVNFSNIETNTSNQIYSTITSLNPSSTNSLISHNYESLQLSPFSSSELFTTSFPSFPANNNNDSAPTNSEEFRSLTAPTFPAEFVDQLNQRLDLELLSGDLGQIHPLLSRPRGRFFEIDD